MRHFITPKLLLNYIDYYGLIALATSPAFLRYNIVWIDFSDYYITSNLGLLAGFVTRLDKEICFNKSYNA